MGRGGGGGLRPGWQPGCTIHSCRADVLRIFVALHVWQDHPALPCPVPSSLPLSHLILSAYLSCLLGARALQDAKAPTDSRCTFGLGLEGETGSEDARDEVAKRLGSSHM